MHSNTRLKSKHEWFNTNLNVVSLVKLSTGGRCAGRRESDVSCCNSATHLTTTNTSNGPHCPSVSLCVCKSVSLSVSVCLLLRLYTCICLSVLVSFTVTMVVFGFVY